MLKRLKGLLGVRPRVEYSGVGRNDVCPCGSGRKFKACCIERAETQARSERNAKLFGNRK